MGLHLTPNEPDDWANGPYEPDGQECSQCEGTGEVIGDDDLERTCLACGGSGVVGYDDELDWSDDD